MKRPLITWLAFAACVAAVAGVMGWVTATVLRLEVAEIEAERRAEFERIALWRMDSLMLPLIAQESARSFAWYEGSSAAEAGAAEAALAEHVAPAVVEPGGWSPQVVLHFQIAPDGALSSPTAPDAPADQAVGEREAALAAEMRRRLDRLRSAIRPAELLAGMERHERMLVYENDGPFPAVEANGNRLERQLTTGRAEARGSRGYAEYQQRVQSVQNAYAFPAQAASVEPAPAAVARRRIELEPVRAVWRGDDLLLVRRARADGAEHLQGCLLDWPTIRRGLAAEVADLLPAAELVPVPASGAPLGPRLLATLPARLEAGPLTPVEPLGVTPMRFTLAIGWLFLLAAAGAAGLLLWGTLRLSERRAAFVSAVTHELRTPLTTFRLYTGMLVDGLVSTEDKRTEYLATLQTEADRLEHLVDNVLSYSRLERAGAAQLREPVDLGALVSRLGDSLGGMAARSGMKFVVELPDARVVVAAERGAVERILFNLVDNACKYAAGSEDGCMELAIATDGGRFGTVRVRDNGPGIDRAAARRLFRPFSKPVSEAARTAPGVGLGLALSRRLARRMGGDLSLDATVADGACFILKLPIDH
ncbi:MAG: HAMP domain-containing sensor histidine kinase [Planctomycetales bacterium]